MDKKRAAAIAGAIHYLQAEAEEREHESAVLDSRRRRSGWSAYGRNAVARGRRMVQGRRRRRNMGSPRGRGHQPGISRSWIRRPFPTRRECRCRR